ncbi:MAG: 2-oxoglutarate dehydrogenase E1 component, partial [Rickettsiales bacterium]
RAIMMIRAYRMRGHLHAKLDPLGIAQPIEDYNELSPASYGFTEVDYDRRIFIDNVLGLEYATIPEMLEILDRTYCSTMGVEFMHISDPEEKAWLQERIEGADKEIRFTDTGKKAILQKLIEAEGFEQFIDVKYKGTKRFGLDGAESLIPALEQIVKRGGSLGMKEIVLGMAHRGRLNVLTKVMGKPYAALLAEFQGGQTHFSEDLVATGDVKYHQGVSSDRHFDGKKIHLSLSPNPSHLEAVNPVVAGRARARQNQHGDAERRQVLPILVHGDAAFAGQGVVWETLALGDLDGYTTGGTVHIIINNQIGFTTNPASARKSPYPADIAKGIHAPIFHVNGDEPESVVYVSRMALEFRQKFGKDVVVDVFCYRRYGHNEGDEPFFTQPRMYSAIAEHERPVEVYKKRLIEQGRLTEKEFDAMRDEFIAHLNAELDKATSYKNDGADWFQGFWSDLTPPTEQDIFRSVHTGIDEALFTSLGERLSGVPEGYEVNKKLVKQLEQKREMLETGENIDWALAEGLAFASLLEEGNDVRVSGQDAVRGTFSHRHSAFVDQTTEKRYFPLKNLSKDQGNFEVIDSNLSEYAVLGFEYGYSLTDPNCLVIWEAQFGDFANGAQIMFDQFISSAEAKWLRFSGLTMLLPHGYEGQGPEHSSARLERFLQLCAENNMQVLNCTTPANFFHALRRQMKRNFRKPLIVMSPKSLLRHKECVSSKQDFLSDSGFLEVINDGKAQKKAGKIRKVVLCSGKIFYELRQGRDEEGKDDVAIVRVEQLYPFPQEQLKKICASYKNAEFVWCQEEPRNMGAWHFMDRRLEDVLRDVGAKHNRPIYAGRPDAASPAAGYPKIHNKRQKAVVTDALA